MILQFLRLFSAFREMESDRDAALAFEKKAEDERDFWRNRCLESEAEVKRLNEQLVIEAHKVTDVFSTHAIGRRVYTKADPPPASAMPTPNTVATQRMFGREAVQQQTAETQKKLQEIWNSLPQLPHQN